ncbi:hypothetical protein QAD02_000727 [Eretmocerus hayati]|uniref:Uncharacterized protein n=1 Tax=Eretmocerus hayati TaxID=131215 RepID=A0ACC2NFA0_9HYME|nr:hypothetical protein QAD02_000727 [Eretmocerus hayati]
MLRPADDVDKEDCVEYGHDQELVVKMRLEAESGDQMRDCGAFVYETYEFLIASPDAVIGEKDIVEMKSLYTASSMKAEDAVRIDGNAKRIFTNVSTLHRPQSTRIVQLLSSNRAKQNHRRGVCKLQRKS